MGARFCAVSRSLLAARVRVTRLRCARAGAIAIRQCEVFRRRPNRLQFSGNIVVLRSDERVAGISEMKKLYLITSVVLLSAVSMAFAAQDMTSSTPSSPLSWLQTRGTMSADDVVAALGIAPNKEQRAEIEKSTARRNEQLQKINDEFSLDLQKTLAANDDELAAKVQAESDRLKMAKMRSRQPGRYNGVKK